MAHETEKFPDFEILAELGRGTTGVVYETRNKRLNRRLALKALLPGNDANLELRIRQFIGEARALAALTVQPNANIPKIHLVADQNGQPFYAREFIEGATLEQAASRRSIDLPCGLRILSSIAETVGRVHALGIAHGNLVPSNVMVTADNCAKLIGFGKCALLGGPKTTEGSPRASVETDTRALQQLMEWLCATLHKSLPVRLAEAQRLGSVSSPAALAQVFKICADEELLS